MMEISSKNNIRKRISTSDHVSNDHLEDEEMKDVALPGFRFHPTDEELIGFYLRRKVDNKPLTIQLIKQIDIYKYDPWDLPKVPSGVGEKEWYFFCKRGRKYKNSIRPNRVTGSGFWKATGIDKPVHSNLVNYGGSDSDHHQEASDHQYRCIGLKKTLVYYRGSAGKGTKTDWMMHEFRLPSSTQHHNSSKTSSLQCSKTITNDDPLEAEIWTLCRILKRNAAYKKLTPQWKELSTAKRPFLDTTSIKYNNNMVEYSNNRREAYIDFSAPMNINQDEKKPAALNRMMINNENIEQYNLHVSNQFMNSSSTATRPISVNSFSCSSYDPQDIDFFTYGNWDELKSVVDFALNPNDHLM